MILGGKIMGFLEERTKKVIKELHGSSETEWKVEEIQEIASIILEEEAVKIRQATPIVKIAKHYGIAVYKETLKAGIDASIFLNGTTTNIYEKEKVIVINRSKNLYWKRYFVAIELGKYILDFLDNPNYQSDSFYSHQYKYNNNDDILSARFATEILMPAYSFCRQYLIATENALENKVGFSIYRNAYLSHFFEVPEVLIRTRIREIINA